jgi:hypothetical protein
MGLPSIAFATPGRGAAFGPAAFPAEYILAAEFAGLAQRRLYRAAAALFRDRRMIKRAPAPGSVHTSPPWSSTACRESASPRPTSLPAVTNGSNYRSRISARNSGAGVFYFDQHAMAILAPMRISPGSGAPIHGSMSCFTA